jgi:hypothetical protein
MTKKSKPPKETTVTAEAVAAWMLAELKAQGGVLSQEQAAPEIADRFGEAFVYQSDASGNTCIDKGVLVAFRKLSGDSVVWIKGERFWRLRESGDDLTRQQS